jgi:hypothetical protein
VPGARSQISEAPGRPDSLPRLHKRRIVSSGATRSGGTSIEIESSRRFIAGERPLGSATTHARPSYAGPLSSSNAAELVELAEHMAFVAFRIVGELVELELVEECIGGL